MRIYNYISPEDYCVAEQNGISATRVYQRVNNQNWSVERAITQPLQVQRKDLWTVWGDVAKANGVSRSTFYSRVNKKKENMSPELAATKPPMNRSECAKYASNYQRKVK